MDKILDLLGQIFEIIGLDEISTLLILGLVIIISILFKYYLKQRQTIDQEENARMTEVLSKYSEVITSIFEYREEKIKETELIVKVSELLPICSHSLKRLILDYHTPTDRKSDMVKSEKLEMISEAIMNDFNSLRVNDKSNVFKKIGMSLFDNIEYAYNNNGLKRIIASIGLTLLSIFSVMLLLSFALYVIQYDTMLDKINFIFLILYVVIYSIAIILFPDIISVVRIKNGIRSIVFIIITFLLPIISFFVHFVWVTVISFVIFIVMIVLILKKEIKRKNPFEK